jgi:D-alanyl-D-alanine dipeptidase
MGTPFDFGKRPAMVMTIRWSTKQPDRIKSIMTATHFDSFDSEWWHYN